MSPLRFILASLWQYRRTHLAVALGVAVATAVITGALLVGDSVQGSLRALTLERLSSIDTVLVAEHPFREALAREWEQAIPDNSGFHGFAPLLIVPGSLSATDGKQTKQATQLSILGVTDAFWQLGPGGPTEPLTGDEVAISQSIATELAATMGDEVLLRVSLPSSIPADSTLGEKEEATTSRRLRIKAILNQGIARFGLQPSQLQPRNVFVSLSTMQRLLELPAQANSIAIATGSATLPSSPEKQTTLAEALKPELADFGLKVEEISFGQPPASNFLQLSAERLVLAPQIVEKVRERWAGKPIQPVITYLANTISLGKKSIPYSTVTGVDSTAELGPLRDADMEPLVLAETEIALNDWAARDLEAEVGDTIILTYYEPETTHGQLLEKSTPPLTLRVIAPLSSPVGQPNAVADPRFTPELPGVTDERSISDWDLPFRLIEKIRPQDEAYWDEYRTTPKAFVSYKLADKLWSTRWGSVSTLRIPLENGQPTLAEFSESLRTLLEPDQLGMKLVPVKEQGLAAARGTTSFEGLFLGFSFFLMASAVMLISLLFRLGAENRAAEVGILAASGWAAHRLSRVWLSEAAIVASAGALLGVVGGILYATVMVYGLTTWWVAATVTPFLKLHGNPASLMTGFVIGISMSLLTIYWSLKKILRVPPRQLLTGDTSAPHETATPAIQSLAKWLPRLLFLAALIVATATVMSGMRDEALAGAFFASGALVLAGLLLGLRNWLRGASLAPPSSLSLRALSIRNTRRNPSRTILAVGLTAVASFLIVALSAFRLAPTDQGTGGFDLIATADLPIYFDLNTPAGRQKLGFTREEESLFSQSKIFSFRVQRGEDASCLNLYQTTQPQVIGVPEGFYGENHFSSSTNSQAEWEALEKPLGDDPPGKRIIPLILDQSTATYSLHLEGLGARFPLRDAANQRFTGEVVGLLAGSVLQGNLLMSEANFLHLYPDDAGRTFFLIRAGSSEAVSELAARLETRLVDYGFDAKNARERLAEFLAVQNTYLSTFQSLGALGLLLGTIGLAVAQLRSAFERRGELALLRCTGFRPQRITEMLLGENVSMLLAGLGCGCLAALVATLPHWAIQHVSLPWRTLVLLLGLVAIAGVAAGWLAVRAAVRMPLLPSLRGD